MRELEDEISSGDQEEVARSFEHLLTSMLVKEMRKSSGVKLFGEPSHHRGDLLRVELDLPGPPMHQVVCVAKVVEAKPKESQTTLRFEVLHEDDRRAIVAHTLSVQRRELRVRSGMDGVPV